MKKMTPEQLHALALRTGAEATIGGKVFNSARAKLDVVPPRAAPAPAAPVIAPPTVSGFTQEQVDALLASRDAVHATRIAAMQAELEAMKVQLRKQRPQGLTPVFDNRGAIIDIAFRYGESHAHAA